MRRAGCGIGGTESAEPALKPCGRFKAKVLLDILAGLRDRRDGKPILVRAIRPPSTPNGPRRISFVSVLPAAQG